MVKMTKMLLAFVSLIVFGINIGPVATLHHSWVDHEQLMQTLLRNEPLPEPKRIAVIGSGIAGASLAFKLQKIYGHQLPFELVVFDQASHIGGFINSTLLDGEQYGYYATFLDTGASVIRENDICMQRAIDSVGLRQNVVEIPGRRKISQNPDVSVGVWEHNQLIFEQIRDLKPKSRMEYLRQLWRYGISVRTLDKLVQDKVARFRQIVTEFSYPNLNVIVDIHMAGLEDESRSAADEYLIQAGISPTYLHEIVEPTVRLLYGRNLHDMNALSALVAMDPAPTYRIDSDPNGTLELVDRLLRLSRADLRVKTRINTIQISRRGGFMLHGLSEGKDPTAEEFIQHFDAVVVTSPLKEIEIDIDIAINDNSVEPLAGNCTYVTHFTAPLDVQLSPSLFNVTDPEQIPSIIYTTSDQEFGILSLEHSAVWRGLRRGDVIAAERLFKVTSTQETNNEMIAELLGYPPNTTLDDMHVGWVHRQAWPGYLAGKVRGPPIDCVRIAPGLFYTGVAADILPSMEMSCRLGMHIAGDVYREFNGPMRPAPLPNCRAHGERLRPS